MLGNTLYGVSVLLKNPEVGQSEGSYVLHHLPWLVGSLGVLLLDTIVSFRMGLLSGQVWKLLSHIGSASVYLPSLLLFINLFVHLSAHLPVCPSFHPFHIFVHSPMHASIHPPSTHLSTHLLSFHISITHPSIYPLIHAYIHPPIHPPIYLFITLPHTHHPSI